MIFPDTITITVFFRSTLISDLVCSINLLTINKNNFPLGLFKTDEKGKFIITEELISRKMQESCSLFPMDYDNSSRNLKNRIEVTIESTEQLNERLNRLIKIFPEKSDELDNILRKNSNGILSNTFKTDCIIDETITINF